MELTTRPTTQKQVMGGSVTHELPENQEDAADPTPIVKTQQQTVSMGKGDADKDEIACGSKDWSDLHLALRQTDREGKKAPIQAA
ncbi:UNVERIFIED_CONTAM: hypothetical protein K2H54_076921 [Gekko kuhli]